MIFQYEESDLLVWGGWRTLAACVAPGPMPSKSTVGEIAKRAVRHLLRTEGEAARIASSGLASSRKKARFSRGQV